MLLTLALTCVSREAWAAADGVTGTVKDEQGSAVADATVTILSGERAVVGSARTNAEGKFSIPTLPPGSYIVVVRKGAFAEARQALNVVAERTATTDVSLKVGPISDQVTVSASRGTADTIGLTGQPVNVISEEEIANRVKTNVAQAVEGEAGVAMQRTSSSMGGIFIRGLVGNKVNIFVDGVRFSNSAQRGGVNTFMGLIDAGSLDSIEVLRGPSSDQYGSDALGGSVQYLTKLPTLSARGNRAGGSLGLSGGTGHNNGGGSGFVSVIGAKAAFSAGLSGRRTGLLRPGGGTDSHAASMRFLGVTSDKVMDERLPDTGFDQFSGSTRLTFSADPNTQFVASYLRTHQDHADRYDQLLGGDGNLIAELNGLSLDLLSVRMERSSAGSFQHVSFTYGLNSQREERVNQGGQGSSTAPIGHEPERTTIHSVTASGVRQMSSRSSLTIGGDMHFEKLVSDAFNVNATTGAVTIRRPRVPSNATFRQGGAYAQASWEAMPDKVRLVGSIRLGTAKYEAKQSDAPVVSGVALWPSDSLTSNGVGYRAAIIATPRADWTFSALVSRGFRAPHMTDLGTLGLTGSGYEVAAAELRASSLSGSVGTTADATAVSRGDLVGELEGEKSLNVEGTISYHNGKVRTDLTVFVNQIHDNIQKVALILPSGSVAKLLGASVITSQNANGAVFVAASTIPVLVRANFDNARYWGIEHSLSANLGRGLTARTALTYIRAEDTGTHRPPNIEGGTPHPMFFASARWTHANGKWYVEPYAEVAWKQTHLSSLDLGDRRTGAGRTTTGIRNFFNNGARNRGWIGNGADNVTGTADDVLIATGETLAQITVRVLGTSSSSSLFTAIPGWSVFGTRIGVRSGLHEFVVDFENIGDKNYRGMSWGMDAPGRGISARYSVKF